MADYKYRLQSQPEPRTDGSGMLVHDIYTIYSEDGGVTWSVFPQRGHYSVAVPQSEIAAALAQPTTNTRVSAYKTALYVNRNTVPEPLVMPQLEGNSVAELNAFLPLYAAWVLAMDDANDAVEQVAVDADTFILSVAPGNQYPVEFSLPTS